MFGHFPKTSKGSINSRGCSSASSTRKFSLLSKDMQDSENQIINTLRTNGWVYEAERSTGSMYSDSNVIIVGGTPLSKVTTDYADFFHRKLDLENIQCARRIVDGWHQPLVKLPASIVFADLADARTGWNLCGGLSTSAEFGVFGGDVILRTSLSGNWKFWCINPVSKEADYKTLFQHCCIESFYTYSPENNWKPQFTRFETDTTTSWFLDLCLQKRSIVAELEEHYKQTLQPLSSK
ncbi:MAG: hypothetical protein WCW01_04150 [Gammaproteobacteria bacterium]|jgi:hypothetical protein